jgi:hypothetical protein
MEVEVCGSWPLSEGVSYFVSLGMALSRDIPANAGFLSDKAVGLSSKEKRHFLASKNWAGWGGGEPCHVSTVDIWVEI